MEEDLVRQLEVFGLTPNQAKVYLAVLASGSISVGKIAETAGIYRQDIYKIIPKLEKRGLITRTLGSPILIKSIQVKRALATLVEKEKQEALTKIRNMEANVEDLSDKISSLFETEAEPIETEPSYSLLTKEREIINKADLLYEEARTECNVALSMELLNARASLFRERFMKAIKNGATIRLIVAAPKEDERVKQTLAKVTPGTNNFAARLFITKKPKPFHIIDGKNVWISTTRQQEQTGLPCVLWSTCKNIVEAYEERFERIWKSSKPLNLTT